MACITCQSFDPNFKNGYCDYHHCETSPNGSCDKEDKNGGGYGDDATCSTCNYFDSNYHNGYCDYHKEDTYSSSKCSNYKG